MYKPLNCAQKTHTNEHRITSDALCTQHRHAPRGTMFSHAMARVHWLKACNFDRVHRILSARGVEHIDRSEISGGRQRPGKVSSGKTLSTGSVDFVANAHHPDKLGTWPHQLTKADSTIAVWPLQLSSALPAPAVDTVN